MLLLLELAFVGLFELEYMMALLSQTLREGGGDKTYLLFCGKKSLKCKEQQIATYICQSMLVKTSTSRLHFRLTVCSLSEA